MGEEREGQTWAAAVFKAVRRDDPARLGALARSAPEGLTFDCALPSGVTPLVTASWYGKAHAFEFLLLAGCDIHRRTSAGNSPQNFGVGVNRLRKSVRTAGDALVEAYSKGVPVPSPFTVKFARDEGRAFVRGFSPAACRSGADEQLRIAVGFAPDWKGDAVGIVWLRPQEVEPARAALAQLPAIVDYVFTLEPF